MHPDRFEGELTLPSIIDASAARSNRLLPQRMARLTMDKATKESLRAARESNIFFVRHAHPAQESKRESALSWRGKTQARILGKAVLNCLGPNPELGVKFYHESTASAAQTAMLAQEFLHSCGVETLLSAQLTHDAVKDLCASTRTIAEYAYGEELSYVHNATVFVLEQIGVMRVAERLAAQDVPLGFASGFRYQASEGTGISFPVGSHS